MGNRSAKAKKTSTSGMSEELSLDDFKIMRAIGKGAFGKVCIVQKRKNRGMFAMKYMSKRACVDRDAIRNVFREFEILKGLNHPFIVNLWFTFQDVEDIFMVVDLLLGGDLRYHLSQHETRFTEATVAVYAAELASALAHLRNTNIIHRDLKPDNILLDGAGHVHLTDFNIATVLHEGQLATSMSGTKPYMAPEVYLVAKEQVVGYSYAVDWWSLGVTLYELLRGKRPYSIHGSSGLSEVLQLLEVSEVPFPASWSPATTRFLRELLQLNPARRLKSLEQLKKLELFKDMNFDAVLAKRVYPGFLPSADHLNCDPTYELEEMILESNPLHKKKKRLAKSAANPNKKSDDEPMRQCLNSITQEFRPYNREFAKQKELTSSPSLSYQDPAHQPGDSADVPANNNTIPGANGDASCSATDVNKKEGPAVKGKSVDFSTGNGGVSVEQGLDKVRSSSSVPLQSHVTVTRTNSCGSRETHSLVVSST